MARKNVYLRITHPPYKRLIHAIFANTVRDLGHTNKRHAADAIQFLKTDYANELLSIVDFPKTAEEIRLKCEAERQEKFNDLEIVYDVIHEMEWQPWQDDDENGIVTNSYN